MTPYLSRLQAVAVIGRCKWIPGTPNSGFENSCWCLFDQPRPDGHVEIRFFGRVDSTRAKPMREAA